MAESNGLEARIRCLEDKDEIREQKAVRVKNCRRMQFWGLDL